MGLFDFLKGTSKKGSAKKGTITEEMLDEVRAEYEEQKQAELKAIEEEEALRAKEQEEGLADSEDYLAKLSREIQSGEVDLDDYLETSTPSPSYPGTKKTTGGREVTAADIAEFESLLSGQQTNTQSGKASSQIDDRLIDGGYFDGLLDEFDEIQGKTNGSRGR